MFNIGFPELLIIVAIALIVFGPNKLPELAKAFGRAMREFKKATEEVKESFEAETKGLDELKNTFAEEREKFLAGLTEEVSETTEETPISSETTGERMAESEAPASEAASSHRQEEKIEKKEKEEPEEAKEGIPSHG
jgi:Tat protein translocase TatB subunit